MWFLAPKVVLAEQQFRRIRCQIPTSQARLISGIENDTWKPHTWKTVLGHARIVVSTYQILLDALDHAYLTINSLALIIFDEGQSIS